MKKVSTTFSTGDTVKTMFNGTTEMTGTVGGIKQGKIQIRWKVTATSCITENISTRSLNQRIKSKNIQLINQ